MAKMSLSEIAEKAGVPVVNLSQAKIDEALTSGRISPGEAERLRDELRQADGI